MSLVQQWLRGEVQPYAHSNQVYNDVDSALTSHTTIRPKTDVYTYDDGRAELLICLHGLLPISFRGASYNIPVAVWIPHDYPKLVPLVYVVPTSDMLVRASKSIDPSGKCSFPYMEGWERKSEGCNLRELLDIMQEHFSREPPLYAKPPPGAVTPQTVTQRATRTDTSTSSSPRPPPRPGSQYEVVPPRPLSVVSSSSEHSQYRKMPPLPPPNVQGSPPSSRVIPPAQQQQQQQQHMRSTSVHHAPRPPSNMAPITSWNDQRPTRGPTGGHMSHNSLPSVSLVPPPQSLLHPLMSPPPPPTHPQWHPNLPQRILQPPVSNPASPPPPPPSGLPHYVSPPVRVVQNMPMQPPPPISPTPIPNIMDEDNVSAAPVQSAPPPVMTAPPPRPMNPQLAAIHSALHGKFTAELLKFTTSLAQDSEGPRAAQNDLLAGEPAIRDEMARLESVKSVCKTVANRLGAVVNAAESAIGELKRKGDPEVDELVCATNIVHNQLINLIAEDHAIEDTIYHLHRALNDGRLELDKFLKTTTRLAEEQFMKRALIERITSQLPIGMRML